MNNDQIAQTVKVSIDVPVGDVMIAADYCGGSDENLLPTAAAIYLNGRCGDYAGFPLVSELANSPTFAETMAVHGYERVEQPVPSTDRSSLSEYMAFEGYSLPKELAWMDEVFAAVDAQYRGRGVELLRIGEMDLAKVVSELADLFVEREDGWREDLVQLADHWLRLSSFEIEVLDSIDSSTTDVDEMPLASIARRSEFLRAAGFEERRLAVLSVSRRLDYELDKVKQSHGAVALEAEARQLFFAEVKRRFQAELPGSD
jgi:hypothetical protein